MKLIILRGIPGSGKSTKAKSLWGKNTVRVNRDLLREMLNFSNWSKELENETIIPAEKALARHFLVNNYDVIIDDTNLTKAHVDMWEAVAAEEGVIAEVITILTPIETCIERDGDRENPVGEKRIRQMYATMQR